MDLGHFSTMASREDEAVLEALQDLGLTLQDELIASLESEVPLM